VCRSPARERLETLLETGSSYRAVERLEGVRRASLARHHQQHMQPASRHLAVVPGVPEADTTAVDPMREAVKLFERAKTRREQLKAAQAVRRAAALALKALGGEADADLLAQLDDNVATAARLFRQQDGFEGALAGLEGVRESIRHKLDATREDEPLQVEMSVTLADGSPRGEPTRYTSSAAEVYRGVPVRFRDPSRFTVQRLIRLKWPGSPIPDDRPDKEIRVYETATSALVWASRS
jgi:hypothetical protein